MHPSFLLLATILLLKPINASTILSRGTIYAKKVLSKGLRVPSTPLQRTRSGITFSWPSAETLARSPSSTHNPGPNPGADKQLSDPQQSAITSHETSNPPKRFNDVIERGILVSQIRNDIIHDAPQSKVLATYNTIPPSDLKKFTSDELWDLMNSFARNKAYESRAINILNVLETREKSCRGENAITVFRSASKSESLELLALLRPYVSIKFRLSVLCTSTPSPSVRESILESVTEVELPFAIDYAADGYDRKHELFNYFLNAIRGNKNVLDETLSLLAIRRRSTHLLEKLIEAGANRGILRRFEKNGKSIPYALIPNIQMGIKFGQPKDDVLGIYNSLVQRVGLENLTPKELHELLYSFARDATYVPQAVTVLDALKKKGPLEKSNACKVFKRACQTGSVGLIIALRPNVPLHSRLDALKYVRLPFSMRNLLFEDIKETDLAVALNFAAGRKNLRLFRHFLGIAAGKKNILDEALLLFKKKGYSKFYLKELVKAHEGESTLE